MLQQFDLSDVVSAVVGLAVGIVAMWTSMRGNRDSAVRHIQDKRAEARPMREELAKRIHDVCEGVEEGQEPRQKELSELIALYHRYMNMVNGIAELCDYCAVSKRYVRREVIPQLQREFETFLTCVKCLNSMRAASDVCFLASLDDFGYRSFLTLLLTHADVHQVAKYRKDLRDAGLESSLLGA